MATYITIDDIVERYDENTVLTLADDEQTGNIADAGVIARVGRGIEAAEAEVNGFLSRRYTVPIVADPQPQLLVDLAIDMSLWKMARGPTAEDDGMRMRYKDARKLLEQIAKGNVLIGIEEPDQGGVFVQTTGTTERTFSRDSMKDF